MLSRTLGWALIFAATTACGTETQTPTRAGSRPQPSSVELVEGARAAQSAYLRQLLARAERSRATYVANPPESFRHG